MCNTSNLSNVRRLLVLTLVLIPGTALGVSPIGGTPLRDTAHQIFVGWPSVGYEYWTPGSLEWGIGGELTYGPWSGGTGRGPDIGMALNVPFKFHLATKGIADVGLRIGPGFWLAFEDSGRGNDIFFIGARADFGVPVSVRLAPKVSLVTGGSIPFTIYHVEVEDSDASATSVVIPLYPRIGVDVFPTPSLSVWFLAEFGPAICAGDACGDDNVDLGVRAWMGVTL